MNAEVYCDEFAFSNAVVVLERLKSKGITQISEYTLKEFFSKLSHIYTTGAGIKSGAKKVGIKLMQCNVGIPEDFVIPEIDFQKDIKKEVKIGKKFTKEALEDLYINQNMTQVGIAEAFKMSHVTVNRYLKKLKIEVRPHVGEESTRKIIEDIEKIKEMHIDGMKLSDIAKAYDTTVGTLTKKLKIHGYSAREINKQKGRNNR